MSGKGVAITVAVVLVVIIVLGTFGIVTST